MKKEIKNAEIKKTEIKNSSVDVAQLVKENEELKQQLAKMPVDFEARKAYFQEKETLIRRLTSLQESKSDLIIHRDSLNEICEVEEFETKKYKLEVDEMDKNNYRSGTVFTLQNPVIIKDVIEFIMQRMEKKIEETKVKIEA